MSDQARDCCVDTGADEDGRHDDEEVLDYEVYGVVGVAGRGRG